VVFLLSQCHVFEVLGSALSTASDVVKTEWRRLSRPQEERFIALVSRRNDIQQDLAVLARLLDEKMTDKKMIDAAFLTNFGIKADESYRFDGNTRSVYRILVPPQEVLHRSLTQEQTRNFLRYAEVRKRIQVAIDGINVLNGQKKKQWDKVSDEMLDEFGIYPDSNYHFEKKTRVIYKLEQKGSE